MDLVLNSGNSNLDNQDIKYGYVLEIQIIDYCDLNCANCNHFAPIAEHNFLSIKEFSDQLKLLKQRLPLKERRDN